jgi:AraC-like DNA-binding protein
MSVKNDRMKDEIDNLELSLLNIGYAKHHADWNFGPICGAVSRIYWITEGIAYVTINGEKHPIKPNHVYLIPAFVSHYDNCDGIFQHYYVHIADTSQNILRLYERYELPFELPADERIKSTITRLMDLCPNMNLLRSKPDTYETSSCFLEYAQRFNNLPTGIRMEIKGLLLLLLSAFFTIGKERSNVSDKRIVKAQWMIETNMKDTPSIKEMASDVSLCKDRFIRLFHKETGLTPTDYIVRKKILRAQILLTVKDMSVKQVALALGYPNISYFGRVFHKITGMSPMEFKKQNT